MYPIIIMSIENNSDREFIEWIYIEYYPLMKKKAYEIVMDNSVIDDIINEAIIKLIKHIDTLKKLESHRLTSYIVYTIRSVAINFIAKRDQHNNNIFYGLEDDLSVTLEDTDGICPKEAIVIKENIDELGNAISKLAEIDQEILFYKYNLEMSNKDIAHTLNISEDAVRQRLSRAKRRALKILKKEGFEIG